MRKGSQMNTSTTVRRLVFALLALQAGAAQACYSPPPKQLIDADEQVAEASNVALAQVIGATPIGDHLGDYQVEYRLLVLEQLAGPTQKVITVMGGPASSARDTTFHSHQDFAFWARGGGHTMNGADCVVRPGFTVGSSYLVFLGPTPTRRSFEQIGMVDGHIDADDKWLAYVKARLGGSAPGREGTRDYERVGRFIYGFQRIAPREDLDIKALAAQHAPNGLLLRAGRLADEFERIVKNFTRIPDAEIDATLHEAGEVHAALQAWRDQS
jgi:hypothetical protein